jgi:AraC-like DNA-binding protein
MAERFISSLFTARVIRAAAANGLAPARLWRRAAIAPRDDDYALIPEALHLEVWERVMTGLGDPGFPIRYADTVSLDDYGVLGLACKTAPHLGAALATLERHVTGLIDAMTLVVDRRRAAPVVELEHAGVPTLGVRCSIESALAEILGGIRAVTGRAIVPTAVRFRHPRPRSIRAHVVHFGVAPEFSTRDNALILASGSLALPGVRADPALFRYLDRALSATTTSRPRRAPPALPDRVRAEIVRALPRVPRVRAVAAALAISSRTLQRELRDGRTTFARELDLARRELSAVLLADPERSIAEVAAALGFSESSAFTRAHRRWTGHAPGTGRRAPK